MDVGTLIALIISGLTFLISIGGGIYMVGKFTSRMETVEKRQVEDRDVNEKEHIEFRAVEKASIALATKVDTLITATGKMDEKIERILERLPPRRRETDQED
jgi:hypothetical protein